MLAVVRTILVLAVFLVLPVPLLAQPEYPAPLPRGVHVSDRAGLLALADVKRLEKAAAEVEQATGVPLYIVTIRSLEDMAPPPPLAEPGKPAAAAVPAPTIEAYALGLFNYWGVGSAQDNRGILLLYSRDDAKVRIQLGAGWPKSQDMTTRRIMDDSILPAIKVSGVAQGLFRGVVDLGEMIAADTRSRTAQPAPTPPSGTAGQAKPGTPIDAPPPDRIPPPPSAAGSIPLYVGGGVLALVAILAVALWLRSRRGPTLPPPYGDDTGP